MGDVDSNEKTLFDAMESKLVTCKINIAHPFLLDSINLKKVTTICQLYRSSRPLHLRS